MRACILSSDGKEYNEETQFVSYTVEKNNGSRFLLFQFVRGVGSEQYVLVSLSAINDKKGIFAPIAENDATVERDFSASYRIVNEEIVSQLLVEEGSAYALNILPKKGLEAILHSFEAIGMIRATGAMKALSIICEPVKKLAGVEINPVELLLLVAERVSQKKAEGRCYIL